MKAQMKAQVKTHKLRNTFFLFLTAMIWGAAFVAQSVSMDYIGPFTFICLRSVIGGLFLIPVIIVLDGIRKKSQNESADVVNSENILHIETEEKQRLSWKNKQLIEGGIVCGIFLFFANCFQQTGIQYTTVGKAGFITTFYIIIVPLIGLFFKKYCGILTWIGVVVALAGLYFLCITQKLTIQRGDALILCCSVLYAGQILAIDHYNPFVDGVKMSCIQFLTGGILGAVFMLLFENPSLAMILSAAGPDSLYRYYVNRSRLYFADCRTEGVESNSSSTYFKFGICIFCTFRICIPASGSYNKRIDRLCTYVYCDCISAASGYPKKSIKMHSTCLFY